MRIRCRHFWRAFRRDERGVALVEFALLVSLLLVLVFGIIDFGRRLFVANALTQGAREGARFAAALMTPPCNQTAAIQTRVVSSVDTVLVRSPKLAAGNVTVTCLPNNSNPVQVQVTVVYPFTWLTPLWPLLRLSPSNSARATATFRWEGAP